MITTLRYTFLEFSFHLLELAPDFTGVSGQRCCLCKKVRLEKLWLSYVERINPHQGTGLSEANQYTSLRQLGRTYVQQHILARNIIGAEHYQRRCFIAKAVRLGW